MAYTEYIPYIQKIYNSTRYFCPQELSSILTKVANDHYRVDRPKEGNIEELNGYIFTFDGKQIEYRYKNKNDLWRVFDPVLRKENKRIGRNTEDRKKLISVLLSTLNNKKGYLPDIESEITPEIMYTKVFSSSPSCDPITIPTSDSTETWKAICNSNNLLLWYFFGLNPTDENSVLTIKEKVSAWHIDYPYVRTPNQLKLKISIPKRKALFLIWN